MAKDKKPAAKPAVKAGAKAGTNIGGMYLWTQRDFNALMSQIASIQGTVTLLSSKLATLQQTQYAVQGTLQALQSSVQTGFSSVQSGLSKITAQEAKQMSALDDLKTAVAQTQTVEQSAVVLIQGIAKQLNDALANNSSAANDPALAQLRDQLNSSAAELGAAVTANTTPPAVDPNAPQINPEAARR